MRRFLFPLLSFLLLGFQLNAQANDDVEIELLTFGAGVNYWEAYGHSAIRIKSGDIDYVYGFGYFNFADEDFFIKFAKGEMQYFLGIEATDIELDDYTQQGRAIWTQKLKLSKPQKIKLIDKLNFLSKPENRYYHYDYFLNNCTSQIRDILDEVTDGEISKQLEKVETSISWNDATFPVSNQSWMNLGIALGYGIPAYLERTQWQLSIFPEDFAHDLEKLTTKDQWNTKLIQLNKATAKDVIESTFLQTHYAVISVFLVLLIGIVWKLTRKFTINLWLIVQSVLGVGLFMLWFFTQHTVAAYNINVLLFFPLNFLLMFKKFNQSNYRKVFLVLNILWLVIALLVTNLYLIGFLVINLMVFFATKDTKNHETIKKLLTIIKFLASPIKYLQLSHHLFQLKFQ